MALSSVTLKRASKHCGGALIHGPAALSGSARAGQDAERPPPRRKFASEHYKVIAMNEFLFTDVAKDGFDIARRVAGNTSRLY